MLVSYRVTSAWPAVGRASRVFRSFAGGSAEGLCGRIGGQRDCRQQPGAVSESKCEENRFSSWADQYHLAL